MTRGVWVLIAIGIIFLALWWLGIVCAKVNADYAPGGSAAASPARPHAGIDTCSPPDLLALTSLGRGYRPGAGGEDIPAANVAACNCPAPGLDETMGGCGVRVQGVATPAAETHLANWQVAPAYAERCRFNSGQPPIIFSDDHFVDVDKMVCVQTPGNHFMGSNEMVRVQTFTGDYKLAPAGEVTDCVVSVGQPKLEGGPGGLRFPDAKQAGRAADRTGESSVPSATRLPRGADETQSQARLARLFRVTAYCPCARCCGKRPSHPAYGITASGTRADRPLVAAPRDMAFGTRLRIPNYAVGWDVKVEDRGGAIREDRLDVLFPEHESARQWGAQWLDVEVVGQ